MILDTEVLFNALYDIDDCFYTKNNKISSNVYLYVWRIGRRNVINNKISLSRNILDEISSLYTNSDIELLDLIIHVK